MDSRELGISTYGDRCEICAYGIVEVHHIGYQEHQALEKEIRKSAKLGEDTTELLQKARELGFLSFEHSQLDKDDRSTNLAVLCPNCHRMVHTMDVGLKLLSILPPRK